MSNAVQWKDQQIVVLGAARQGLALARFFLLRGAHVTLSDQATPIQLAQALAAMETWQEQHNDEIHGDLHWALGGHPATLLDGCQALFVSGGVPLTLPIISEAIGRGIPLTNDSQIFLDAAPCPVIGITGSAGKTTTTTLLGNILAENLSTSERRIWVGGNIGTPLIDHLDEIRPTDLVLLELSSFQLELMHTVPHISAILNITPNHLDRHGTMEAYTAAKANILVGQHPSDWAILNHEDPGAWSLRKRVQGKLALFGLKPHPDRIPQAYLRNEQLFVHDGEQEQLLLNTADIHLRGRHNHYNVLAACIIATLAGVPVRNIRQSVENFKGVEHRLELVRIHHDIKWYNDSIATAPERTMAAIRSFNEPLVLLLGGRDKDLPWEKLARLVHQRVHDVILFGEAAGKIAEALLAARTGTSLAQVNRCENLEQAVQCAARVAHPGDVVLLSPGGTSYDEFKDFAERGERFKLWVQQIS
ncbi:MAG: UDP-N-acetylmuramoyl-L-alanine--D-glutamate ligase [Anaerolineae bacterium]|nr:UDP-N-acetylmuramoyl-L-alanine--D-glutamate ligase [Anaerolineae bacterium]